MSLTESSSTPPTTTATTPAKQTRPILQQVEKAALSRWKLETLTGLLGIRSLQSHQSETEKNVAAENRCIRKKLWGETDDQTATGEDMANQTILGDYTHPTPIIVAGQQSSSMLPALAAVALGILIPGAGVAGYVASQMLKPAPAPIQINQPNTPTTDESLDIGLGRISDLLP